MNRKTCRHGQSRAGTREPSGPRMTSWHAARPRWRRARPAARQDLGARDREPDRGRAQVAGRRFATTARPLDTTRRHQAHGMPRPSLLETFANPYPGRDYEIVM